MTSRHVLFQEDLRDCTEALASESSHALFALEVDLSTIDFASVTCMAARIMSTLSPEADALSKAAMALRSTVSGYAKSGVANVLLLFLVSAIVSETVNNDKKGAIIMTALWIFLNICLIISVNDYHSYFFPFLPCLFSRRISRIFLRKLSSPSFILKICLPVRNLENWPSYRFSISASSILEVLIASLRAS